jgi:hypothetical protein
MNTNELTALAEKIVNDGLNIFWVHKIKVWFEWNNELAAWVVIREDRINDKLNDILKKGYQDAIEDGDMALVQNAINLFKPSMKSRLVKAIRTVATRSPEFLHGDVAHVEELTHVAEVKEDSEMELPELDVNDGDNTETATEDDRF